MPFPVTLLVQIEVMCQVGMEDMVQMLFQNGSITCKGNLLTQIVGCEVSLRRPLLDDSLRYIVFGSVNISLNCIRFILMSNGKTLKVRNSLTHTQNSQISKTYQQDLFFSEGHGQKMDFEGLNLAVNGVPANEILPQEGKFNQ